MSTGPSRLHGRGDTSKRRRATYGGDDGEDNYNSRRHRRRRLPPPPQQSRSQPEPQPLFPGNLHRVYDDPFDVSNEQPNYFERHRMLPPSILSRSLQEEREEDDDGDGSHVTQDELESKSDSDVELELELKLIAQEAR
eukprot:CAMPEP_0171353274 /NCGR_PEP_ID=MMETSP0878-20121228/43709_1 /TAXON_ID=67004 /ORGANISM="Thalassiosira weissflogii, Strain CCMP1336" /LENGTH=137 /DNA_ID=CAMNT_0011859157 /DNA_START=44 /DNA_END=454 /DNA_ORIENTATION=+